MSELKADLRAQLRKPGSDRAFTWFGKVHVTVYIDDNTVHLFKWNPERTLYRDDDGVIRSKQGDRNAASAEISHRELRAIRQALGLPVNAPATLHRTGGECQSITLRGVQMGEA